MSTRTLIRERQYVRLKENIQYGRGTKVVIRDTTEVNGTRAYCRKYEKESPIIRPNK